MKRKSVYSKYIDSAVGTLTVMYFIVSFILMINENFEVWYMNLLGLAMFGIPIGLTLWKK